MNHDRSGGSPVFLALLAVLALASAACRSAAAPAAPGAASPAAPGAASPAAEQDFVLAFLVKGPESFPPERANELRRGHMENIGALARDGSLLLAGPFAPPRVDPRLRGIFVLDVQQVSRARELVATDPAVAAGQLAAELHPWRSSAPLRGFPALYEELERERLAADPDAAPFQGREYVLAMTREPDAASALLAPLLAEGYVIFHGRFGGDLAGTELWCLDEQDAGAGRARLEAAAGRARIELDLDGAWELHPWFATSSLTRLPTLRSMPGTRGAEPTETPEHGG